MVRPTPSPTPRCTHSSSIAQPPMSPTPWKRQARDTVAVDTPGSSPISRLLSPAARCFRNQSRSRPPGGFRGGRGTGRGVNPYRRTSRRTVQSEHPASPRCPRRRRRRPTAPTTTDGRAPHGDAAPGPASPPDAADVEPLSGPHQRAWRSTGPTCQQRSRHEARPAPSADPRDEQALANNYRTLASMRTRAGTTSKPRPKDPQAGR